VCNCWCWRLLGDQAMQQPVGVLSVDGYAVRGYAVRQYLLREYPPIHMCE
jgi:hypothetical protein